MSKDLYSLKEASELTGYTDKQLVTMFKSRGLSIIKVSRVRHIRRVDLEEILGRSFDDNKKESKQTELSAEDKEDIEVKKKIQRIKNKQELEALENNYTTYKELIDSTNEIKKEYILKLQEIDTKIAEANDKVEQANNAIMQANKRASEIIGKANTEVDNIYTQARKEAELIKNESKTEVTKLLHKIQTEFDNYMDEVRISDRDKEAHYKEYRSFMLGLKGR